MLVPVSHRLPLSVGVSPIPENALNTLGDSWTSLDIVLMVAVGRRTHSRYEWDTLTNVMRL